MDEQQEKGINITEQIDRDVTTTGIRSEKDDTLLLVERIFEELKVDSGTTILDLGCNTGYYHEYEQFYKFKFVGVDNRNDFRQNGNVYIQQNLQSIPYSSIVQKFDYVMCLDVLEHLFRPDLFLMNIYKNLLNDGGYLLLSVPNIDAIDEKLTNTNIAVFNPELKFQTNGRWTAQHIRYFDFDTLGKLCKQIGFKVSTVTGCNFYTSTLGQLICKRFKEVFNIPIERTNRELGNIIAGYAPNLFFLLRKPEKKDQTDVQTDKENIS